MPNWDSNDPREFGWSLSFRGFVPFVWRGYLFPQGVHPLAERIFATALDRLAAAGLQFPPHSEGLQAGMWGQEDRPVVGGTAISFHQYGLAIDVCAPWNPRLEFNPPASPYRLPDNTCQIVEPLGLLWGGSPRFGDQPDRMHLEVHLSPAEISLAPMHGIDSFPLPTGWYFGPYFGPEQSVSGDGVNDAQYRPGLAHAQARLGVTPDGYYGPLTAAATRSWQLAHHLGVNGLIGAHTWSSLFPGH